MPALYLLRGLPASWVHKRGKSSFIATYLRMQYEKTMDAGRGRGKPRCVARTPPQVDTGIDATARGYYSWCAELMTMTTFGMDELLLSATIARNGIAG